METTLDKIIKEALKQDSTVELSLHERYGFAIKIDGTKIVKDCIPYEDFEMPLEAYRLTEEGKRRKEKYEDKMWDKMSSE